MEAHVTPTDLLPGSLLVKRTEHIITRAIDLAGILDAAHRMCHLGNAASDGNQRDGIEDHPASIASPQVGQQITDCATGANDRDESQYPLREIARDAEYLSKVPNNCAQRDINWPDWRLLRWGLDTCSRS